MEIEVSSIETLASRPPDARPVTTASPAKHGNRLKRKPEEFSGDEAILDEIFYTFMSASEPPQPIKVPGPQRGAGYGHHAVSLRCLHYLSFVSILLTIIQKASEYTDRFRQWIPALVDDLLACEWSEVAGANCGCGQAIATLKCDDCIEQHCVCENCMRTRHALMPFHRLRRWTGDFFKREPLCAELWLGHAGSRCPNSRPPTNINIAHLSGIFDTIVHACGCAGDGKVEEATLPRQLMRQGYFPGSLDLYQVHWAFAVPYLDHWLAISHHAKVSMMDYWATTWFLTTGFPAERVKHIFYRTAPALTNDPAARV